MDVHVWNDRPIRVEVKFTWYHILQQIQNKWYFTTDYCGAKDKFLIMVWRSG